jgi:multiple sugar transport system substrate-binding protein
MKRYLAVVAILCAAAGLAFATGGAEPETVIRFWSGERHTMDFWQPRIEQYNATIGKQQGIRVDYKVYGEDFANVYDLAFRSGQAPEMFDSWGLEADVAKGYVQALEDVPALKEYLATVPKDSLIPGLNVFNGKTYGIPHDVLSIKFMYNKDIFREVGIAKPPETWNDVVDYARRITEKGNGKYYGIIFPFKWGADYWKWVFEYEFIPSIGAPYFDPRIGKFNFSAYLPAFQYMLQIKKDGSYFPGSEGLEPDPCRAQFAAGKAGMIAAVSWDIGVMIDQFKATIDWAVIDLPVIDKAKRFREPLIIGTNPLISSKVKKENLAKVVSFWKWFRSDEHLVKLFEGGYYLPAYDSIAKKADMTQVNKIKGLAGFGKIDVAAPLAVEPGFRVEGKQFNEVFDEIWIGTITDVAGALKDLDARYNAEWEKLVKAGTYDSRNYVNSGYNIQLK